MLVEISNKYHKLIMAVMLAVFSAGIVVQNDLTYFNGQFIMGWNQSSADALIFIYLCLLFATFLKRVDQRAALMSLAAVAALFAALPSTLRIFEFRGEYQYELGTSYSSILILTLLIFVFCALLIVIALPHLNFVKNSVETFMKSTYSGSNRIMSITFVILLLVLFLGQIFQYVQTLFAEYENLGDHFYSEFRLVIYNVVTFLIAVVGLSFLQPVLVGWLNSARGWVESLNDFSISTYLTRRISSALYGIIYVILTAVIGFQVPNMLYESLGMGSYFSWLGYLGNMVFFPVAALMAALLWFFSILILRLTFEFTNAIIHIAESASKNRL